VRFATTPTPSSRRNLTRPRAWSEAPGRPTTRPLLLNTASSPSAARTWGHIACSDKSNGGASSAAPRRRSSLKGPRCDASAKWKPAEASPASAPLAVARRVASAASSSALVRATATASRQTAFRRTITPAYDRRSASRAASPRVSSAAGDVNSHGSSCSGSPRGAGGRSQCSTLLNHEGASGAAQDVLRAAFASIAGWRVMRRVSSSIAAPELSTAL